MGSKGASAPAAPDPTVVDAAQTQSNIATADAQQKLNLINTNGPYGSVNYTPSSAPGGYTETTTLSPQERGLLNSSLSAQQGALNIGNQQLGRVSSALGQTVQPGAIQSSAQGNHIQDGYSSGAPIQYGYDQGQPVQGGVSSGAPLDYGYNAGGQVQTGLGSQGSIATGYGNGGQVQGSVAPSGQIATGYGSGGQIQGGISSASQGDQAVQNAANAAYQQQTQYLTPQYQQANEQLQSQLAAQGLNSNDAAYQNAVTLQNNQQNQGYQGALSAATAAGDAEQSTLYGQSLSSGQFANSAQQQANTQNAAQAAFQNAGQAQTYGEGLSSAQLQNSAQSQLNSQNAAAAAFQNAGQQQGYSQALGTGHFANAAQAQQYGENQGQAQFYNTTAGQGYTQGLESGTFANQAAGQENTQNLAAANLYDTAQQSQYGQNQGQANFYDQAQNQGYEQNYNNAQLGNTAEQQLFQQQAYGQSLPINELSSLLGLSQVTNPTGVSYTPSSVASTNVLGAYGLQTGVEQNNYNQALAQQNSSLGGLFNLGSSALSFL